MNIAQLMEEGSGTLIMATPLMMREFALNVVKEYADQMRNGAGEEPKYSPTAFAERHGVNKSTLHRWCKAGLLKKHCVGGKVYYRDSDLVETA